MLTTEHIASELSGLDFRLRHTLSSLGEHYLHRLVFSYFSGTGSKEKLKSELNPILCGLIDGFQTIENHSMSDINRIIEEQKRAVEAKLALISGNDLAGLMRDRRLHESKITEIDAKLSHICQELGLELDLGEVTEPGGPRTRMPVAEIEKRILEALKAAPDGLSQAGISEVSGVSYASVMKWVRENPDKVRTQGEKRGRKVFLV